MRSDDWNTDSSDNYTVYVKAPKQASIAGMSLYADKDDAEKWTDGTQVDFVVKIKNVDLNGYKVLTPVVKTS
ncbi:hypothetical protein ACXOKH_09065, partial [Streptococcus thermophilus]